MYPKNNASPEKIPIGPVVQISDGAVQTTGVTVRIIPSGVAEGDGSGTTAYSTDGVVLYTPTQAETNYASFILIAKKTGCIPASILVVPTAESTAGKVSLGAAQTTDITGNLSGSVGSVTGHTPQTGDSYPIVSSATYGNSALKTLIDAVDNFVDTEIADIQSRLPAALTSDGMMKSDTLYINGTAQSNGDLNLKIDSRASQASVDDLPTNAELATALSGLSTHSAADVATAINSAYNSGKGTAGTIWRALYLGSEPIFTSTVTDVTSEFVFNIDDGDGSYNVAGFGDCILRITKASTGIVSGPIASAVTSNGSGQLIVGVYEAVTFLPTVGDTVEIIFAHVHDVSEVASQLRIEMDNYSTKLAAIVADTNELQSDWANGGRLDLILDARASQSSLDTLQGDVTSLESDVAAILLDTGTTLPAQIAALLTTAGAESYRADGSTGSVFQLLYEIHAELGEFAISGTTKQHKKLDGLTNAFASTLDDATNPTSVSRAA